MTENTSISFPDEESTESLTQKLIQLGQKKTLPTNETLDLAIDLDRNDYFQNQKINPQFKDFTNPHRKLLEIVKQFPINPKLRENYIKTLKLEIEEAFHYKGDENDKVLEGLDSLYAWATTVEPGSDDIKTLQVYLAVNKRSK